LTVALVRPRQGQDDLLGCRVRRFHYGYSPCCPSGKRGNEAPGGVL